jgi:methylglyoxal synthase
MPITLALVAHDRMKPALAGWVARHATELAPHAIVSTATTGATIRAQSPELPIRAVKSGPLGGDQQIGGMIAEGEVHALIFFPDPLTPQAHDVDVKALLRIALVYDIPAAFSPATADLLVKGGLLNEPVPAPG